MLTFVSQAMLATKIGGAAVAGVASHLLYFIRGEHHLHAPSILLTALAAATLIFCSEYHAGLARAATNTFFIFTAYNTALFTSIIVYRTTFHPLRSFPGPRLGKVSKLWHVLHILDSKNHLFLQELYERYGSIVRTGPSEVTVFEPGVFQVIGGPGTACIKSAWYDLLWPLIALNSIREKNGYAARRRLWDNAFKPNSLKNRKDEGVILKYVLQLEEHLQQSQGQPVNVLQWFGFLSFDIMGDFAFANSFNMLKSGKWDSGVKLVSDGINILGPISPVPWLAQIAFQTPGAADSWKQMLDWCKENMSGRLDIDSNKPDVSYWLIDAQRSGEAEMNLNDLYGDAVAVVIAGSHTTASSLTFVFYELAMNLGVQTKLHDELKKLPTIFTHDSLVELPYLNAVINESLRLHSVLPTGGNRQTGPEGVYVEGQYIPPHTTVVAPRHTISRLESCFEKANEFVPERWTEKPEMIKDIRAFQPFNLGRHSCPGKNIGLMELRITIALLVTQFDISLAPSENGRGVVDDMRDTFTAQPGDLKLVFRLRTE
ncbi:hypothetical protein EAF04_000733 [Stromatinia cepivora]|nr:hypothetical protein EAF04_000733 [Stromatinia cepivora]